MADVVIVAPLVTFEGDDWKECRELGETTTTTTTRGLVDVEIRVGQQRMFTDHRCTQHLLDNLNEAETDRPSGPLQPTTTTPPLERLIDWDRSTTTKPLCRCFGGSMAPRNHRTPTTLRDRTTTDDPVSDNLIWNQVPEKFDNADPQSERNEAEFFSLEDSENSFSREHPLSEDDESGEAMEMSCVSIHEEPIKTADEVISEIVEMMEDDMETDFASCSVTLSKTTEALQTKLQSMRRTNEGLTSSLKEMPLESLRGLQEELDSAIRDYSEVLLCQLVRREELGFQKELFNQFISLLLSIQKKRRMLDTERKKGKALMELPTYRYLTTVIPYDDHQRAPDTDLLQIYIKLLSAIDEDNSKVPALLTDYILNVLCPKT